MLNNTITVDSGYHTACAVWYGDKRPHTIEINAPEKYSMIDKMKYIHDNFSITVEGFDHLTHAIIEGVTFRENSFTSRTAAVKGDLSKLAYVTGILAGICLKNNLHTRIIEAHEWKGQLTKEATAERVKRISGHIYSSEHITDAVAIGFSQTYLWRLKNDSKN